MNEQNINSGDPEKVPFTITPVGSLGLLALGDLGLRAWRKVKLSTPKGPKK